jgi:hypothetical protein
LTELSWTLPGLVLRSTHSDRVGGCSCCFSSVVTAGVGADLV